MAQTTSPKKKSKPAAGDDKSDDTPSLSERGQSGMRIAGHLQKAAAGGKLRKGFALWRASKELPTAAAGAGDLFKRHPVPIALLGGALTTAALLYAAHSMGAFAAEGEADGHDEEAGGEAEASADENEDGQDEEDAEEDE